jgi:hypothetical protein
MMAICKRGQTDRQREIGQPDRDRQWIDKKHVGGRISGEVTSTTLIDGSMCNGNLCVFPVFFCWVKLRTKF